MTFGSKVSGMPLVCIGLDWDLCIFAIICTLAFAGEMSWLPPNHPAPSRPWVALEAFTWETPAHHKEMLKPTKKQSLASLGSPLEGLHGNGSQPLAANRMPARAAFQLALV